MLKHWMCIFALCTVSGCQRDHASGVPAAESERDVSCPSRDTTALPVTVQAADGKLSLSLPAEDWNRIQPTSSGGPGGIWSAKGYSVDYSITPSSSVRETERE